MPAENPLGAVAYDEARKAVEAQAATLDSVQTRAGTLLAAASLVTSFFGTQALGTPTITAGLRVARASFGVLGWAAVLAFIAVTGLTIAALWPREWKLDMRPGPILDATRGSDIDERDGKAQLAAYWDDNYEFNKLRLDQILNCYQWACIALGVEVVAWLLDLQN